MRMRRGEVARAETQRSVGRELDVNGYELLGGRGIGRGGRSFGVSEEEEEEEDELEVIC